MLNLRFQLAIHITNELVFAAEAANALSYSNNLYDIYREQMSHSLLSMLVSNVEYMVNRTDDMCKYYEQDYRNMSDGGYGDACNQNSLYKEIHNSITALAL